MLSDKKRSRLQDRITDNPNNHNGLLSRHIATEHFSLAPVQDDEHLVSRGKHHAQIRRAPVGMLVQISTKINSGKDSPEDVCHGAASGKVPTEPANVGNGTFAANISQAALVRVFKRTERASPPDTLL